MQRRTLTRTQETSDEIWLLEHSPVFTQGMAGKKEHVLNPHNIPIVQTDRGGQVTYHGPGQLVLYALIDLRRKKLSVRHFVTQLEEVVIHLLATYNISSNRKKNAPGIYVKAAKICSIGLKVKHGCSYHGIALNVDMDLTPFTFINPCGFKQLTMTQIKHFKNQISLSRVKENIISSFMHVFDYDQYQLVSSLKNE
jgi:lipoyl(octanoyl) transferase